MTCDSSSLSAGTRWVWIILQRKAQRPWSDPVHGWSAAARTEPPHVLRLALSPSCWVSSACLPRPSPKKASIKSPLKTTTGLDSHKLEQNNLFFPKPPPPSTSPRHAFPSPTSPCLFRSVPHRQRQRLRAPPRGREPFLFTDAHCIDVSWFHQATLLAATHPASFYCLPSNFCVFMH